MLLTGFADLVYKRGAAAGAPAHQFLMVQTWVFFPTVAAYALLSGSLPLVAASLWGTCAGGFMLLGAYLFARSLRSGSVSINAPVFRLSFVLTAALVLYQRGWWDRVRADAGKAAAGSPAEHDPVARPAIDPAANEAYLNGVAAAGGQTYEALRNAIAYFEDAVAKQPDFAPAYAYLGHAQLQFLYVGPLSPRETVPKAEAATRKALQLDDTLPLAHQTLATILRNYHWRWEDAEKEALRARALKKSPAEIPTTELIQSGQFALAIAQAERARRLDPLSFAAAVDLASAFRAAGQYDRAIAEYRTALQITPGRPRGHFQLGVTFVFMGRLKEAIDELETAVRLSSGNPRFEAYLAYAYAAAGRPLDARRILKALEARAKQQYVSGFGLALIYDAIGERERALAAFERAYQDRAVEFSQMPQYPPFKTIASDPRYQARMREIGLPR